MSSKYKSSGARRDGETEQERARRRMEKKQRVDEHRQKVLNTQQKKKVEEVKKVSDFISPIQFEVAVPELPIDAKHMAFPFDDDLLWAYDLYHGVSSEAGALHGLHAEFNLGMRINLMDTEAATLAPEGAKEPLDPLDAYITSDAFAKPASKKGKAGPSVGAGPVAASGGAGAGGAAAAASGGASSDVEWMIRPNYMHLDLYDAVYKHADARKEEAEANRKRIAGLRARYAGPRLARILEGFATATSEVPVHPTNPRLKPAKVWSVLPDPDKAGMAYVHVSFDSDPTAAVKDNSSSSNSSGSGGATTPGAARRAKLTGSVIRTAPEAQQPHTVTTDGTVTVNLLVPEPGAAAAAAGDGDRLRHARNYHMLVEKPRTGNGSSASSSSAAKGKGGGANAQGDEQLVLLWNDARGEITYAHIRTRASLTAAASSGGRAGLLSPTGGGGVVVPVTRRPHLPEEEEAMEAVAADLNETDAQARAAAKAAVRERRLERLQREAEAAAEVAGAASSSAQPAATSAAGSTSGTRTYGSGGGAGRVSAVDFSEDLDDEEDDS